MLREGIPEKAPLLSFRHCPNYHTHTQFRQLFTFVFAPPPNLGNAQKKMFVLLLGFLPKVGIGYFQLLLHFSHKRHKTAPQLHCCCTSWTAVLLFSPQKTKKCQNQFGIPSLGRDWLLCCSIFHTGGTRQDPSALLLCLLDHGPQFLRSFVLQGSCQSNNSSQIRITSSSWPNKG